MITVTEAARAKFLEIIEREEREGHGLRVMVHNGGTFQPEFALNFVGPGQANEDDIVVDAGGFNVYVDPASAGFLKEASVDFLETPTQSGFKIDAPHAGLPKPSGPLAEKIEKVLNEKVNPGVAGHGGHVELAALEDNTAFLRFGGGCQGCGMIKVTLKEGVEKILLQEVPELERVADVTDHAAGSNPYYRSEG
jgi:Fe/S biogenesis protein NfuA